MINNDYDDDDDENVDNVEDDDIIGNHDNYD